MVPSGICRCNRVSGRVLVEVAFVVAVSEESEGINKTEKEEEGSGSSAGRFAMAVRVKWISI